MKVIDLLNKIANGKEVPKRIKYEKHIYEYEEGTYDWSYYIQNNGIIKFLLTDVFNSDDNILNILNGEVEILEEEKKIPEKLKDRARFQYSQIPTWLEKKEIIIAINENFEKHQKAIYEIIDYLKSKGE